MEEGMLPGWWLCRECGLFLDVQGNRDFQLIQYRLKGMSQTVEPIMVPSGCLLVLSWEAA